MILHASNITIAFLMVFALIACGSESSDRTSGQQIQSRSIEQMSAREAQLLGLDKPLDGSDTGTFWAGPKIYTIDEAQALAAESGKKILVDVYTVWCGYCRKMAAETYTDKRVQEMVDKYFYTVRVDAESDRRVVFNGRSIQEFEFALTLNAVSFPTTAFIDSDGEPIGLQPGYMDAGMFQHLLGFVGSDAYKTESFDVYVERNRN